jgi:hypothetical protein
MYGKRHVETHEARNADTKEWVEQRMLLLKGAPKPPVPHYSIECTSEGVERKEQKLEKQNKKHHMVLSAHLSAPAGFIIVSFPDEAAFTICCSTDLFILALSAYDMIQ